MTPKTKNVNWIYKCPSDIPRIEACFSGKAYAPHRHDDYTLALTTEGIQSFNYRGEKRHSQKGQVVILHPDELHDGMSGTDGLFAYRAISIDPRLIQDVLGGKPLPFIEGGIVSSGDILDITLRMLGDLDHDLKQLEFEGLIYELAVAMDRVSTRSNQLHTPNVVALKHAREFIECNFLTDLTLEEISASAGYSKWHLSRDFKTLYGTSPYQYVLFLRLFHSKSLLEKGVSLSNIAYDCLFSDQSHFTRKFKQRFGLTPNQWQKFAKVRR